ncbi:Predicted importin 9 [Phaffia rhodozyma]|uniref:Predicted importin 9 n=1 Tax=Phaffia rhodozyma TaxID=264483 RepID=A0A0F7SGH0_PHARH|nr:Predicted importin 9 [Phaffia rhodozyma]
MDSQLVQTLSDTLSSDGSIRHAAEEALQRAMDNQDMGIALTQIILTEDVDLSVRQTAGVMLKKFMDKWWDVLSEENSLSVQTKQTMLQYLLQSLSLPSSKLRTLAGYSLSVVLLTSNTSSLVLPSLLNLLATGSPDQVHGAMRVFRESVRKGELDLGEVVGDGLEGREADLRVLGVVNELSPVLLQVLGNETHSPSTRASTISVFRQCLFTIHMMKDQLPQESNELIGLVIPPWLEAFVVILGRDEQSLDSADGWEHLGIKKEIYKTINALHQSFPRSISSDLIISLLPLIFRDMKTLLPPFYRHFVSTTSDDAVPSSLGEKDEETRIEQVVCPILDLMIALTRANKLGSTWVGIGRKKKGTKAEAGEGTETAELELVVEAVLGFTAMTTEDEDSWANDPNAFVADDDDETDLYNMRIAGHDFVSTLLEKYPRPVARVLQKTVHARIESSKAGQISGDPDWWKGLESSLALIGGISDNLLDLLEEEETVGGPKSFDLGALFDQVISRCLGARDVPFLQGRAFVMASQYATALSSNLATQYLEAAVQVLEGEGSGVAVKICAVKTIKNFCRHISTKAVQPLSHRILSTIVPLILQAGDEVLALVLESLRAVLGVDESALEPGLMGQLVDVLLEVWAKNVKDPIISSTFEDLFAHLASTPSTAAYAALGSHSIPRLCTTISSVNYADPDSTTLAGAAVELLSNIFRGRRAGLDPEGKGWTGLVANAIFPCLIHGDDMELVQNGVEVLILLIRKDCQTILSSTDPSTGQTGLDSTFAVIARLLRPGESESKGLFLGDLLVHLFRNAGQAVGPVLPDLVRAIVERLQTAVYATFQQSLIIPLAYLIYTSFDMILPILESCLISTTSGQSSGLAVLLRSWCENAETFHGSWAIRVSTLGLGALLVSGRESLKGVTVRGDMIVDERNAGVIMTRSRTKNNPTTYSSIPFLLKALKLTVSELNTTKASASYNAAWEVGGEEDGDEDEDDDGEDDGNWEDDGPGFIKRGPAPTDEFGFLSDMMGPDGLIDDDEGDREDEDLATDSVSTIDMNAYLVGAIRRAYEGLDSFGALAGGLNEGEMSSLGNVLA